MRHTYTRLTPVTRLAYLIGGLLLIALFLSFGRAPIGRAATTAHAPTGLQDYERWFGSQHAHTNMDGDDGYAGSTAADAFAYARNVSTLDYYIITPHVHQNRTGSATLWSEATYQTIRASAIEATTANFVAIAGQEVSTIGSGGHWSLFNAAALVGTDHPDGDWNDADDYYDHVAGLGTAGEVIAAQFDHPQSGDFGKHKALITRELYDKCRAIRQQRGRSGKSYDAAPKRFYLLHRIIRCAQCGRPLRMQNAAHFYYYKDASHERGVVCEHGTLSIRMDRADEQALALLRSIQLPDDWQTTIERLARDGTELAHIEARREQLIDQQRRLSRRYQDGLVSDDEYERTRDQLKTELDRLVIPDSAQTIELGLQMESLGDYLAEATEAEQAEISHLLLEATHFDLAEGRLVRLKPAAEFRFLFDLIGREMNWQAEPDGSFRL